MAMTMSGEVQLAAPRQVVWSKLNDAEVLKQCIPGCEELNKNSDTEFQAVATIKVGPVKAKFKGRGPAQRSRPAERLQDFRRGRGRRCRICKGRRHRAARRQGRRHAARYDVESQIGGKLAQLGQRLVQGTAKKLAEDFFNKFAAAVAAG